MTGRASRALCVLLLLVAVATGNASGRTARLRGAASTVGTATRRHLSGAAPEQTPDASSVVSPTTGAASPQQQEEDSTPLVWAAAAGAAAVDVSEGLTKRSPEDPTDDPSATTQTQEPTTEPTIEEPTIEQSTIEEPTADKPSEKPSKKPSKKATKSALEATKSYMESTSGKASSDDEGIVAAARRKRSPPLWKMRRANRNRPRPPPPRLSPSPPPPVRTSETTSASLSSADIGTILSKINGYREQHSAPPLQWDNNLANVAQQWANQCKWAHSGGRYGETLAQGGAGLSGYIDMWYKEVCYYNWGNPDFSADTGHFAQLVWSSSQRIGCALQRCVDGWTQMEIFVCEYDPPGNYVGTQNYRANVFSSGSTPAICSKRG